MNTFHQFLSTFDSDTGRRGKQFESFVKWFLINDPEWSSQVDTVWLWDEFPQRWGRDCGIDLAFRHKNGEIWAVQAKCYSPEYQITKHDVDKFLSESNRKEIDKRLLISTTDRLGANARQVCEAQDKQVVRYMLSHFEDSSIQYPESLSDLNSAKPKPKPKPRTHQIEAIDAVAKGMTNNDRGQLIMACGTGKTYTTLWIKERLKASSTLVLLPSLSLLSQTLHEWIFASNEEFEVLCVCSDTSVGKKESDEIVTSISDLAFPVTSDASEIARFLLQAKPKVIFSTYQSSQLIADAQLLEGVPSFDLVVADEAHRCTGKVDSFFSHVLSESKIRAGKRLFATATPKTYSTQLKKSAEDRGVEIFGMDDPVLFGEAFYTLNFGEAIKRGLLTDYQVVIIGVDSETVGSFIREREFVKISNDSEDDAESLGAKIGLIKAIKDFNLRRIISFHSRVNRAKEFSEKIPIVLDWMDEDKRPSGRINTDFVSGDMPTDRRRLKLKQLENVGFEDRSLLSNARCLAEGVDVPSLDGVCFVDPRSSTLDIIQSVGRAIRLSENKKIGTIVLPIFITDSEANVPESIASSKFKTLWDVLNALKSHDDRLNEFLKETRFHQGKGIGKYRDFFQNSNIVIDLPQRIDQNFIDAFSTLLVENTTESWDFYYGVLSDYVEKNGEAYVPQHYVHLEKFRLGTWVSTQRANRQYLSDEKIAKLEKLPNWTWDAFEHKWNEAFNILKLEIENCDISDITLKYKTANGFELGSWVGEQRKKSSNLSDERKSKLDSLRNWTWSVLDSKWETGLNELRRYFSDHHTADVPQTFVTQSGFRLGQWISHQRRYKDTITADRRSLLESIDGWSWGSKLTQNRKTWDESFTYLSQFITRYGNATVPTDYQSEDGFKLEVWVSSQKVKYKRGKLSPVEIAKLEAIDGWVWDSLADRWNYGFDKLKEYVNENGHALVPYKYITRDGYKLGVWVGSQRSRKDKHTQERRELLESLGSWTWAAR